MTTPSEIRAVDLNNLSPGSQIDVETTSRHYHIECLGGNRIRISGHPAYCPTPVPARFRGSLDEEGVLEFGVIGRGRRLTFILNDRPVTTTSIIDYRVEPPPMCN
jgi:hypothetical protein